MLMQLAAAVATQGTHRWKIGGDRYKRENEQITTCAHHTYTNYVREMPNMFD